MVLSTLSVYTKQRCNKYKLLLTSSDILVYLREIQFQTNAKFDVKIKKEHRVRLAI